MSIDEQEIEKIMKSIDNEFNVQINGRKIPLVELLFHPKKLGVNPVIASYSLIPCAKCYPRQATSSCMENTFAVLYENGDGVIVCRNCAYFGFLPEYDAMVDWKMRRNLMMQEEE